jgi:hypothetical protein
VDHALPLYDHPIVQRRGGPLSGAGRELEFVGREFCAVGDCLEAARLPDGRVAMRSTLAPDAPLWLVTAGEWAQFLRTVKDGGFDGV